MDEVVRRFLIENRIAVVSVPVDDATLHAATMHFAHSFTPLSLVFVTHTNARKMTMLNDGKTHPAAIAIGFNEDEMITLQMEGTMQYVTDPEQKNKLTTIWSHKFPGWEDDEDAVFLHFVPKWWRYTELKKVPPVFISSS